MMDPSPRQKGTLETLQHESGQGTNPVELTASQVQAILRERAKKLARPAEEEAPAQASLEVLIFRLGEERYALETRFVQKVFRPAGIARVPRTETFFLGVTNHQGQVLALMDLSPFLGRSQNVSPVWVLVLGEDQPEFGIPASAVEEVVSLRPNAISPPPKTRSAAQGNWIRGQTREGLCLLDGEKLLTDPGLVIDES